MGPGNFSRALSFSQTSRIRWSMNNDDTLYGGEAMTGFFGGTGSDVIDGEAGDDYLVGDQSIGPQPGSADTFVFQQGHGDDTISKFKGADKIGLTAFTNIAGWMQRRDADEEHGLEGESVVQRSAFGARAFPAGGRLAAWPSDRGSATGNRAAEDVAPCRGFRERFFPDARVTETARTDPAGTIADKLPTGSNRDWLGRESRAETIDERSRE